MRVLVAMWLTAAGCGAEARRADEYKQEYWDIRCELDWRCPEDNEDNGGSGGEVDEWYTSPCDRAAGEAKAEPDRCDILDEDQAERCLDALDRMLEAARDGSCLDEPVPAVCDDVVTRRDGDKCYQGDAGRPIRVDGRPLLASVVRSGSAATPSPQQRRAGEQWLLVARLEHASVAAFGRVAAQLMAAGAPLELVDDCHRAALDEVHHARLACTVADELLGGSTRFDALPLAPAPSVSLWDIAQDALLEGCVGEGIAAAEAKLAAELAREDIAEVLAIIAEDEARHAALAWKTLRWALEQDASLGPRLERLVRDRIAHLTGFEGTGCPELGVLSGAHRTAVERHVLTMIVEPILRTMRSAVCRPRFSEAVRHHA